MVLAIRAENLSVGYLGEEEEPVWVVKDVNLSIENGEAFCLVGESGCGKTTLASAIAGILPPHSVTRGKLYIFDKLAIDGNARNFNEIRGRVVSYIPQNPGTSLSPYLTIGEHFYRVLRDLHGLSESASRQVALKYLEKVNLSVDVLERYPHELSGGMQQRVAIALAMATGARIIIADEPTSAIDAHLKYQIVSYLKKLFKEGDLLTLIIITHEIPVAQALCNKVAVMYAGRIVEVGNAKGVFSRPRHPYTTMLLEATPVLGHRKQLRPLPGEPPDPTREIPGCPLYPRCSFKNEAICVFEPPMFEVDASENRYVRCWLYNSNK